MAALFPVLNASGGVILPTANGTLYTAMLDELSTNQYNSWQFFIEFFSDAEATTAVTPSAGTVSVSASPCGNVYLTASNVATISATAVSVPDGTYTPPTAYGRIRSGKITFAGVTGAASAKAYFVRM